ncbi:VCBS repeat domain-containing M23 family metallopeptidase [Streptomyces sp. NPDC054904]|uniref:VCBS repeat domain-containing M23 family metallopeptidase n=1 Tax=unclassified Streptomyces TaxID=2593676 RepID=UPI0029B687D6|nr:VCBS repeat domain-containing M23 family metallopeptidase [Streptomyces sp. DK15]MDX2395739.1 VCBS repeat domain-containing M23 family metallopeptidase [Streptomyces sp. DK15]
MSAATTPIARRMSKRVAIATGLICATLAATALSIGGAQAEGEDHHGVLPILTPAEMGLPDAPIAAPMAASATTDGGRPKFQMPFTCGETWLGDSRSYHSPSANAIDWTHGGTTTNKPVLASAGGTAHIRDKGNTSYGKFVTIDHGNGWSTLYAHLNAFKVSEGEKVDSGELIGLVGSTGGSSGAHLHYEQRYNGSYQRTVFNGSAFYPDRSLTSKNCVDPTPDPKPQPPKPPVGPGPGTGMIDLASADLSGDGVVDVVGVEASTGKLWLYKGNVNGTIASGGSRVEIGSGGWNGMSNLTGGDFTGDGKDDIVGVEESTGKLWLYKGADNSTLTGGGARILIGTGGWNGMSDLTALNLNGDTVSDLAGVEKSTGKLYLYPGSTSGQLGARKEIGSGGWNGMSNLTGMDVNNSGKQDLVAVEESTGDLYLYPGDRGYLSPRILIGNGGWNSMSDLIGGDLKGTSGPDDLIAVQNSTGKLFLYPGTGTGLGARTEIGSGGW